MPYSRWVGGLRKYVWTFQAMACITFISVGTCIFAQGRAENVSREIMNLISQVFPDASREFGKQIT